MMLRTVQSPLFSRKIVENQRYAILTGSSLSYLMDGGRFGNPEARCSTFESNYKMAANEGERSISTILRKKGDCEQTINVTTDCNLLFHHVN